MKFTLFENVYVEIEIDQMYTEISNIISKGVSFFCSEFNVKSDIIKVMILISMDYARDVKKIHLYSDSLNDFSENGSLIIPVFQKEEFKNKDLPIIVINWSKFSQMYGKNINSIIESVVIHELVHCYDHYITYNYSVVQKYGNVFEKNTQGSFEDKVGGIYQNRSEVRAKFYQEKYLVMSGVFNLDIAYMTMGLTKIDESEPTKTFYTLAHARAQLLCWETILREDSFQLDHDCLKYVVERKQEILEFETKNKYKNMADLFKLEDFHKYCDGIKGDFKEAE